MLTPIPYFQTCTDFQLLTVKLMVWKVYGAWLLPPDNFISCHTPPAVNTSEPLWALPATLWTHTVTTSSHFLSGDLTYCLLTWTDCFSPSLGLVLLIPKFHFTSVPSLTTSNGRLGSASCYSWALCFLSQNPTHKFSLPVSEDGKEKTGSM